MFSLAFFEEEEICYRMNEYAIQEVWSDSP